jgi:hypothetical protein
VRMKTLSFQSFCPLNPHGIPWFLHSCGVFTFKALPVLSFHKHSDPLGGFDPSSPSDGEYSATPLAILLLKPLLEYFWVFSNPVKVPSVDLSSNFQNSKSSFPLCYLHASLDVLQTELIRILDRILVFLNSQQSSSLHTLNTPLVEFLQNFLRGSVHNSVPTALP